MNRYEWLGPLKNGMLRHIYATYLNILVHNADIKKELKNDRFIFPFKKFLEDYIVKNNE